MRYLSLGLILFFASCSPDGNTCSPNKTDICHCPDGQAGIQTCLEDGSGWTVCDCPCEQNCDGRNCGPDPICGESCGDCPVATEYCSSEGICIDDCEGRECGLSPVEGYSCGQCDGEGVTATCNAYGRCKLYSGNSCNIAIECLSGFCKDGTCCDSSCETTCHACNLSGSEGTCTVVIGTEDYDSCEGICGDTGSCLQSNGEDCSLNDECLSDTCSDDVCCDYTCDRLCWTCILPGTLGTCTPVTESSDSDTCFGPMSCNASSICIGRVTVDTDVRNPAIAWGNGRYGFAWQEVVTGEGPKIYFSQVSDMGQKIGDDLLVVDGQGYVGKPSLVWNGQEYGLVYDDARSGVEQIYFASISIDGNSIGEPVQVVATDSFSGMPSLVWSGSEYAVTYSDYRDGDQEIYFCRLSSSGQIIGEELRVTLVDGSSRWPRLVWTGEEYGVVWVDTRDGTEEIYFNRISISDQVLDGDLRITNSSFLSDRPSISWNGSEYGVAWHDTRDGDYEVYFSRISASGVKIGEDIRITEHSSNSTNPSVVSTGDDFTIAWLDQRNSPDIEVYVALVSDMGQLLLEEYRTNLEFDISAAPPMAWTGIELGLAIPQMPGDGHTVLFLARMEL